MSEAPRPSEQVERILEERARVLAQAPATDEAREFIELVVVTLGAERYGLDILQVQTIQAAAGLMPVPGLPDFWAGLVNLRSRLYPVLDLRRYLALAPTADAAAGKVVLVSAANLNVALWVDDVTEVRRVPLAEIGPPLADAATQAQHGASIRGITPDMLLVLDLVALLGGPRLVVQSSAG